MKPFETQGEKTVQGRGEESVSTFHYPESPCERTYADVITKISRMDSLRNFLTHGAPLRALCVREGSAIIQSEARYEEPLESEFIILSRLDRAGIQSGVRAPV